LFPEVDAFMGVDQVAQVSEIVGRRWPTEFKSCPMRPSKCKVKIQNPPAKPESPVPNGKSPNNWLDWINLVLTRRATESLREGRSCLAGRKCYGSGTALEFEDAPKDSRVAQEAPIVQVNLRPSYIPDYSTPRFRLTPRHFAYLKIAEDAIIPAAFARFPACADPIATGRKLT
jgi:ribosomal protein S12 methylthiotransferase